MVPTLKLIFQSECQALKAEYSARVGPKHHHGQGKECIHPFRPVFWKRLSG